MPRNDKRANAPATGKLAIAIMAAGKGTRLKSKLPKVLHQVGGKPMLAHVIAAAARVVSPADIFVIIGHEADRVRDALSSAGVNFVLQEDQRGTGHAVMVARGALSSYQNVIVLSGDVPLIASETISKLRDFHQQKRAAMTILSARLPDPTGYGRILRKRPGGDEVKAIVEQKALSASQQKLDEINSGIYAFATAPLFAKIDRLGTDNAHHEYYLTDMAAILAKSGQRVLVTQVADPAEVVGSNTRSEIAQLDRTIRMRTCKQLMNDGVTIYYPETCVIDADVQVAPDAIIEPFVQLRGRTQIGPDARIGSYSVIEDSVIGDRVEIRPGCVIEDSRIEADAVLGPYSHLRPGSDIGEGAHIGNFVETKKVRLGRGSKANHLTYLGDAEIGEKVNVGAGTITCNYDGVHKHQTVIEDGAFIGSDATLVAPVRVGRNAYVAAGSTITQDVPEDSLAIARGQQANKEGWAKRRREKQASAAKE
ncbi:MAG: bifunctional UDP-N-acetylglucosamine diphosphorylase/glucosamine-1-phosphate N-acetyltransferase GlmU [Acidobacteria bacterium]|nr:bifunctional UDP-N-acetylglucosamine diphosphorylase/glucosamine-1-phosphate N-acetyltransferase GlmU [Acidobacteriota bacterium]